jgi:hypothetical protein
MSEARTAWRRASRGLFFLGFGVFLLLTTVGVLEWSFWIEALTYWPLLLVGLGIRMIFERSAAPWAVLISPLVVFGTLGWVAATHPVRTGHDWGSLVAESHGEVESWSFHGEMAMLDLDLETRPLAEGRLVEGRVAPRRERSLRVRDWDGSARVELANYRRYRPNFIFPNRLRSWELGLRPDLPLALGLAGAFTEGDVDLRGTPVTRIDLDGAFHSLTFMLSEPDSNVRISVEGAFNDLAFLVPPGTPATVSTNGIINVVRGRRNPPPSDTPAYKVRVNGVFNHVEIRSDPEAGAGTREVRIPVEAVAGELEPGPADG